MFKKFFLVNLISISCCLILKQSSAMEGPSTGYSNENQPLDSETEKDKFSKENITSEEQKKAKNNKNDCPLHSSAAKGNNNLLKHYLNQKMDVDTLDSFGRTPLFHAVINKKYHTIKFLLERHADAKLIYPAVDKYFARPGYEKVQRILELHSQDALNKQSYQVVVGEFIFKLASEQKHEELKYYLHPKNIDLLKNAENKSPLYYAILAEMPNSTDTLINEEEKLEEFLDAKKKTIILLLDNGANFNEIKDYPEIKAYLEDSKNKTIKNAINKFLKGKKKSKQRESVRITCLNDAIKNNNPRDFEEYLNSLNLLLSGGISSLDYKSCLPYLLILNPKEEAAKLRLEIDPNYTEDIYTQNLIEIYNILLKKIPQIKSYKDNSNKNLIHLAVIYKSCPEVIRYLIENTGIDLEERDSQGLTPMILAITTNSSETVDVLKDYYSQNHLISFRDNRNRNLLHLAVEYHINLENFIAMFEMFEGKAYNEKDARGLTPLALGIRTGNHEAVEQLLKIYNKEDLRNYRNNKNRNLLHLAAQYKSKTSLLKILVTEIGVHLNATDRNGLTPLALAIKNRNQEAVEHLLYQYNDQYREDELRIYKDTLNHTYLHLAVQHNLNREALNVLLNCLGENIINARNQQGQTALALAITTNHELAEILLPHYSKEKIKNYSNNGQNYLHLAAMNNVNGNLLKQLLACSTADNITRRDAQDFTPFGRAISNNNREMVNALINSYTADSLKNYRNYYSQQNLLHLALSNNLDHDLLETVFRFFDNSGITACDHNRSTPLSIAITTNNQRAIDLLLPHYSPAQLINYVNNSGQNLLYLAVAHNNNNLLRDLIGLFNENDILLTDNHGNSALSLAFTNRNIQAISILTTSLPDKNVKINVGGQKRKLYDLATENNIEQYFPTISRRRVVSKLGFYLGGGLTAFLIFYKLFKNYKNKNQYI